MNGFRFSLKAMLSAVPVVAVTCAALFRPKEVWEIVISAVALACLIFAPLAAVYGRNAGRAFWLGFAVAGWVYIGLDRVRPGALPTSLLTARLKDLVIGPPILPSAEQEIAIDRALIHFSETAYWLWCLILGLAGALVARQLHLRRERQSSRNPPAG